MKPNPTLYNNCRDHMPPDWSLFDAFEIQPVADDPESDAVEPTDDESLADFWSVYGHLKAGGVECITDVSTLKLAELIAQKFSHEQGLSYYYGW